jgi:hypothetical protein
MRKWLLVATAYKLQTTETEASSASIDRSSGRDGGWLLRGTYFVLENPTREKRRSAYYLRYKQYKYAVTIQKYWQESFFMNPIYN